uniref:Membrane protein involved in aromatic hydrocarbon degradation n=1 Tax=Magnetococcus massalia (strain MO-1) TaxID=451514 RepID=A0A1S7LF21_MAGMO|nr:Membrane protein involved in aromatic hydrocarbon degradation [Candidatus Magnetococcus massalia]
MRKQHMVPVLAMAALFTMAHSTAHATNGMNLEGYGARSHAMGGAAMGFDTGNSNMMNNPAAASLSKSNQRIGVGLRMLGPDVAAESTAAPAAANAGSDGDAYYMPSFSYMRKSGKFDYGLGVFAQGGMGTEYKAGSTLFAGGLSYNLTTAATAATALSGLENRSELSVGRAMLPLAYRVNDKLSVGGSVDLVWMGLDMKMDMDGNNFAQMMIGGNVTGSMVTTMQTNAAAMGAINYGRFDFSDGSDFTGEADGLGAAFKLGFTYKVNNKLTVGGAYHSQTAMSDLEADNATVSFNTSTMGTVPLSGKIKVKDFEWPQKVALGGAYQVNDKFLLVGDVSWTDWSSTMEKFKLQFESDNSATNQAFGFNNQEMNVVMDQNWDDMIVLHMGGEYKVTDVLALRAGFSISDNPIPNNTLNPLFPAVVPNHITGGFGYDFKNGGKLNASLAWAPETDNVSTANASGDMNVSHGQLSWAMNYSYDF